MSCTLCGICLWEDFAPKIVLSTRLLGNGMAGLRLLICFFLVLFCVLSEAGSIPKKGHGPLLSIKAKPVEKGSESWTSTSSTDDDDDSSFSSSHPSKSSSSKHSSTNEDTKEDTQVVTKPGGSSTTTTTSSSSSGTSSSGSGGSDASSDTGSVESSSTTANGGSGSVGATGGSPGCVPITCGEGQVGDPCGLLDNGCGGTINCGACDTSGGKTNNMCVDGECSCTPNPDCSGKVYNLCGEPDGCGVPACCPEGTTCIEGYCAVIYTQLDQPEFDRPISEEEYKDKTNAGMGSIVGYLGLAALPIAALVLGVWFITKMKKDSDQAPLIS